MGVCPGCFLWVFFMGICHGCLSRVFVLGVCPECLSWVFFMGVCHGFFLGCLSVVFVGVCRGYLSLVFWFYSNLFFFEVWSNKKIIIINNNNFHTIRIVRRLAIKKVPEYFTFLRKIFQLGTYVIIKQGPRNRVGRVGNCPSRFWGPM